MLGLRFASARGFLFLVAASLQMTCVPPALAVQMGPLTAEGETSATLKTEHLTGNRDSSFINEGFNYVWESTVNYSAPLGDVWKLEGQTVTRKTDDREIEARKDLHLLSFYAKAYSPNYALTFGDFFTTLSDYTLSRNLEGFLGEADFERTKAKVVLARVGTGEQDIRFPRYVFGERFEQKVIDSTILFLNEATFGENFVLNVDDGAGGPSVDTPLINLQNSVYSFDVTSRFFEKLNSKMEVARSDAEDEENIFLTGDVHGTAFKLNNDYTVANKALGETKLFYDYERVDPGFTSDSGSFSADREEHFWKVKQRFSRRLELEASYRQYRDNLKNLTTTTRTKNPVFAGTVYPWAPWKNFKVRASYDLRDQESPTVSNETQLTDIKVSNKIRELSYSTGFRYRRRDDFKGTSESRSYEIPLEGSYAWTKGDLSITPRGNYKFKKDVDYEPDQHHYTHLVGTGVDFSIGEKARGSASYDFEDIDRGGVFDQDATRETYALNFEVDLRKDLTWSILYRDSNTHQEDRAGFEEKIGETKLTYRF